jgi:transposase
MGKPYSLDLRERVVAAIEGGMSTRQAAARFAIGIATAGTWARLKRATGDVRPANQGKPKGSVLDAHADFILGLLAQAPDTTLDEMVERLQEEREVTIVRTRCGSSSIVTAERIKKDPTCQRARTPRCEGGARALGWPSERSCP